MLDLLKQLFSTIDFDTLFNVLIGALAAWLGVPLVVKEPARLPIIGRLFGGKATDDLDAGFKALRDLDAIHERQGIDAAERQRLFVDGVKRIVAKSVSVEPVK